MIIKKMPTDKWWPILEVVGIPKENIEKVSEYLNYLTLNLDVKYSTLSGVGVGAVTPPSELSLTTPKPVEKDHDLLPINIQVINKISNLDKVTFMEGPMKSVMYKGEAKIIQAETYSTDFKITRESLFNKIDPIEKFYEEKVTDKIAKLINDKIAEGYLIYIYIPIQSIKIIAEKTMAPAMYIISRITYLKE